MTTLVLASASPRRVQLLRQVGLDPVVDPAHIDETVAPGTDPTIAVGLLAEQKANVVVARHLGHDRVVIAADTVVCVGDATLGKPTGDDEARAMLRRLSGRTHEVHTGVEVVSITTGERRRSVETTHVTMRVLGDDEIAAYVASGEPADVAGGYAIQGRAAVFVSRIEGDYTNVVGLPLATVASLLDEVGMPVTQRWSAR